MVFFRPSLPLAQSHATYSTVQSAFVSIERMHHTNLSSLKSFEWPLVNHQLISTRKLLTIDLKDGLFRISYLGDSGSDVGLPFWPTVPKGTGGDVVLQNLSMRTYIRLCPSPLPAPPELAQATRRLA